MKKIVTLIFLSSLLTMQSCFLYGKKENLSLSTTIKQKSELNSALTSVNVSNNTVTIQGTGLSEATIVQIQGSGVNETLNIDSKSDTQIIASALNNFSLLIGATFNLIIGTADAQVTYTITFTLQDGAVTASKLAQMNASTGQVLKWNGSLWGPASLNEAIIYAGTWNASNDIGGVPDLSTVSSTPGEYYIASHAGDLDGVTYSVGDWIISNGYEWQKIEASKTSVTSFQGRKGIVVLTPADYVSLKDTGTSKITGSSINDLADIDLSTAPTDGQVLVYETAGGLNKWIAGNAAAGGIALTDLSASSPLTYNNTTGAFSLATADLLALPLTGLTSGSGALAATDSILAGLGKLMSVPSDYVSKSSGATMTTGTIALSGTAMITVPTATGVTPTEVANVTYVTNALAANGVWAKGTGASSSTINYMSGNVGIGITGPSTKLHVVGSTGATIATFADGGATTCTVTPATTGFACSSDKRLKKNIETVLDMDSLDKVLKLRTVTYNWRNVDNGRHTGYLAQEVEEIAPEMVRTGDDGYKQVSYSGFIPWITGAIKAFYGEFKTVVARVMRLEEQFKEKDRLIASKADLEQVEKLEAENTAIKKKFEAETLALKKENELMKAKLEKIEKLLEKTK